ncbi:MAG: DUF2330 domain-containing protein [Ferruginibacter sp.]
MKRKQIIISVIFGASPMLYSFCGFYVSKADGTIKNKTSQVILVRDGNKNVITMYNDFQGETKDFAMVVPVPVVLQKNDIHVVDQTIFQRLNDYSSPRLVEYYDENPCNQYKTMDMEMKAPRSSREEAAAGYGARKKDLGVKIEAKYLVGEYDILILSAKESGGLKEWLTTNGYKVPKSAEEVLDPYIKSNLKFFVVKVNEAEKKKLPGNFLRPLQISFNSPKFMLPIRLGMANADGDQDLIVYAFTRKGRIECSNYRNVDISTGNKIPLFVKQNFASFYGNLFTHQWEKESKSIGFLEYAWDVSPANYLKCDPCVGNPPTQQDMVQAGVWWLQKNWEDYSDTDEDDVNYNNDKVYFTRLHFRYNRQSFPQDLIFQVTPNKANFQARYIITHPATGDLNCDAGRKYFQDLKKRRKNELKELTVLTGKNIENWQDDIALSNDEADSTGAQYAQLLPVLRQDIGRENHSPAGIILFGILLLGGAGLLKWKGLV